LPSAPSPPPESPDPLRGIREAFKSGQLITENVSKSPDSRYKAETHDLDVQQKKAHLSGLQQDIAQRKTYTNRTFYLVLAWLVTIAVILFFQGFTFQGFRLDSSVLMVLIGSTTTGVIGLFLIVTRYLFPPRVDTLLEKAELRPLSQRRSAKTHTQ